MVNDTSSFKTSLLTTSLKWGELTTILTVVPFDIQVCVIFLCLYPTLVYFCQVWFHWLTDWSLQFVTNNA